MRFVLGVVVIVVVFVVAVIVIVIVLMQGNLHEMNTSRNMNTLIECHKGPARKWLFLVKTS